MPPLGSGLTSSAAFSWGAGWRVCRTGSPLWHHSHVPCWLFAGSPPVLLSFSRQTSCLRTASQKARVEAVRSCEAQVAEFPQYNTPSATSHWSQSPDSRGGGNSFHLWMGGASETLQTQFICHTTRGFTIGTHTVVNLVSFTLSELPYLPP